MTQIEGNFEYIHFTECYLKRPIIDGSCMIIKVSGLHVLKEHPLSSIKSGPFKCLLVFKGVSHSSRIISEYIGNPKSPEGFREPKSENDGPFNVTQSVNKLQEFGLEGYFENPPAWVIDWVINAKQFILEVDI